MKTTILLIFWMLLSGCAANSLIDSANAPEPDFSSLVRLNPIPQTQQYISENKYADAHDYLSYFMDYDFMKENEEANRLSKIINETRNSWKYQISKIDGCWKGESDETGGQIAAITCDFFGFGDLRDLTVEGNNFIQGKEIDKVNLALSAGGVAATVGAATMAIKPTVSILKITNKAGKMPKWLGNTLIDITVNVNKRKGLDDLKESLSVVNDLQKNAGTRATLELLAKSKDLDDFKKLAVFGKNFGAKSGTLLKIGGEDAISVFNRLGQEDKDTILEAATYGKEGIKFLEENGSAIFKSSQSSIRRRMTNLEIKFVQSGSNAKVNGREFIKRNETFDPKFIDAENRSNVDRMKLGLAPVGKDGNPVNLHHMKQQNDGLICELTQSEHNKYSGILHRYLGINESEINRPEFNSTIKPNYWKSRANDFE
jgi:hypothetical protein